VEERRRLSALTPAPYHLVMVLPSRLVLFKLPGFIKDSIKIKVTEEAVTLSFHSWSVHVMVYP
jgi:HSP20 family molecular chaperone IbpA